MKLCSTILHYNFNLFQTGHVYVLLAGTQKGNNTNSFVWYYKYNYNVGNLNFVSVCIVYFLIEKPTGF